MEQYLWLYVNYWQDDWAEWLPIAKFAYKNRPYLSTGNSLWTLRDTQLSMEKERSWHKSPRGNEFVQKIREARKEVEEVLKKTNEVVKRKAASAEYKIGDLVWVDGLNISSDLIAWPRS